tara:strand:+ start:351 stop:452 length:102 start_codon:yes stop_codon:yes gene_type:complete
MDMDMDMECTTISNLVSGFVAGSEEMVEKTSKS